MSDKYDSLKEKLEEECTFPTRYMYKFIVPKDKVDEVLPHFETADVTTKRSKTGKYVSVSAMVMAFSSGDIISKYKSIGNIEGMISL
jgi:putative lipoic acid-binding regulatory protein